MTAPCGMVGSAGLLRNSHGCAALRRPKVIHTACRTAQNVACHCRSKGYSVHAHGQGHEGSWSGGSRCRRSVCMQQPSEGRRRHRSSVAAAPAAQEGAAGLAGLLQAIQAQLQGQAPSGEPAGADLEVQHLTYHPAGAEAPLLRDVSLRLPPRRLGLVYGRSGSGKSTLLQLLAGLLAPTSGTVALVEGPGEASGQASVALTASERLARVGLVFQFPERHFLATTLQEELLFGWPSDAWSLQQLSVRAGIVLRALGLDGIPLETPLRQLSDGYKRRAALAVALVRRPSLLLLDEPLAGLDWQSRADIAGVLGKLKTECSVLVVSHDLRELAPLVDCAWEMEPGGQLRSVPWPPES